MFDFNKKVDIITAGFLEKGITSRVIAEKLDRAYKMVCIWLALACFAALLRVWLAVAVDCFVILFLTMFIIGDTAIFKRMLFAENYAKQLKDTITSVVNEIQTQGDNVKDDYFTLTADGKVKRLTQEEFEELTQSKVNEDGQDNN